MIKIYGISASRAFRCLWLAEELKLDYQRVSLDFRGDSLKTPEYLAINPNARVPSLQDGDLTLWESMAINLYMASKYGREEGFWPDTPEAEGQTYQWTFWVMSEIELPLLSVLMHKRLLPEDQRDEQKLKRNLGVLKTPMQILDQALEGREYLVHDRFTVADLNLAAVFSWVKPARLSLKDYPHLDAWLNRCLARPARKTAQLEAPE